MRVLFNALQAGNQSGTGVYTSQLARRLPGLDADAEIQFLWPEGVPTLELPEEYAGKVHIVRSRGPVQRVLVEHLRTNKEYSADLVHYPCNVIGLRDQLPAVVTVHDLTFLENPTWYRWERALYNRWGVGQSVKRARRIVAVSEATAKALVKELNVERERIDVIYNGVDERFVPAEEEAVQSFREKYKLPERFFLFVGTFEPRKNVDRIIRGWARVAEKVEVDLVLAGREGWKTEPIQKAIDSVDHPERIHRIGFLDHDDLPGVMCAAEALVYPSLAEGFGIPVAEAMACGTPVITSKVSSLPEVAGDAGLLVDPLDVGEIGGAMWRIGENEALREDLSKRGIERAKQFSWQTAAEQVLETYRRALA
jgi:glycosyltransferase involved in cell wall biosynthesis